VLLQGGAPVEAAMEKDAGTKTYEAQANRGVPEYNIICGDAAGWAPGPLLEA
jgi:hypothetical protein